MKVFLRTIFFLLFFYIVLKTFKEINFDEILNSLRILNFKDYVIIFCIVIINFFFLTSYDYLGNLYFNLKIPVKKVYLSSFIVYGFSMNFGPILGSVGLRLKLYSELGLSRLNITKIIFFSTVSNWFGLIVLLSFLFIFLPEGIQNILPIDKTVLGFIGGIVLTIVCVLLSYFFLKKKVRIKNIIFKRPSFPFFILLILCSLLQWCSQILILFFLIKKIPFFKLMFIYFFSSLSALVSHIPGGLGIFESVMIMGTGMKKEDILVSLVIYRVLYFFVPGLTAVFLLLRKTIKTKILT